MFFQVQTQTHVNKKSTVMLLLLCSALLQILFVNGGFVDITLHNDTATRTFSFTYDGYIGFFSKISVADSPPFCKFSYLFEIPNITVTSTTCSDLNITEYGDSFECSLVGSTSFECQRMGRNSSCDDNKSWTVFYLNMTSLKQCAGICSVNVNETINATYQENITTIQESACPRPTNSTTTEIPTTLSTLSKTSTPTLSSSATSQITNQPTKPDSDKSTVIIHQPTKTNVTKFIPLIAGLGTSLGILIIFIIGMIVVCMKRRTSKRRNTIQRTSAEDPNVGNEIRIYDGSDKTTRGDSIYGRDLNKLSGIDLDVLDNGNTAGNDATHNNNKHNTKKKNNLLTDQGYCEIGIEQLRPEENNKNNLSGSPTTLDKDNGYLEASMSDKDTDYLEVSVPKSDGKLNGNTTTTSHSHSNEIDTGYEHVGGIDKPISNIYARLGDSIREFENPYNETSGSDNYLRQSVSENVNVNAGTNPRHNMPDTLGISPGPDDFIVVEEPNDVYAQVMTTKKPDVAISYV
ncbi:unnamed protein product [Lymnaea stagnalis]|uniref:Uncharacterized protein n=1 Tax=Lymnaea stagnalis TaxID=6523 RepID=A0AAV2H8T2_LYMST